MERISAITGSAPAPEQPAESKGEQAKPQSGEESGLHPIDWNKVERDSHRRWIQNLERAVVALADAIDNNAPAINGPGYPAIVKSILGVVDSPAQNGAADSTKPEGTGEEWLPEGMETPRQAAYHCCMKGQMGVEQRIKSRDNEWRTALAAERERRERAEKVNPHDIARWACGLRTLGEGWSSVPTDQAVNESDPDGKWRSAIVAAIKRALTK